MKTKELLHILENHQEKSLLFQYNSDSYVDTNYHITEVKHLAIDSVDCGAQTDTWNETIVQLWESPLEKGKEEYMTVYKALGILKKVGKMKPYDLESEIKFEYGNDDFHTAQLFVNDFDIKKQNLIIKLAVKKTECKAAEVCGVKVPESVMKMVSEPCCAPDGNCC